MVSRFKIATKQSDVYSFSFTFLCLENGDPRLRTPRMRPASDGSLEPEAG